MQAYLERILREKAVNVVVKPNSSKNEIASFDSEKNAFKISIKAPPESGKANLELIKFLSKLLKKKVEIVSGLKSRKKVLKIS